CLSDEPADPLRREGHLFQGERAVEDLAIVLDFAVAQTEQAHALENNAATAGFRKLGGVAEDPAGIASIPFRHGIGHLPSERFCVAPEHPLEHMRDRIMSLEGTVEGVVVDAIIREEVREPLAVSGLDGGGELLEQRLETHRTLPSVV